MQAIEELIKYGGGLVALGTVIFMAGKLTQAVDYLKGSMDSIQNTLNDHHDRLIILEKSRRARGRK